MAEPGGAVWAPRQDPSDDELVMRSRTGDRHAFDSLARRHQQQMKAVCRRVTGNEQDASDALQDALTNAWLRIGAFDGRSHIATWLHRIAANAAIDEVRRRGRRPTPAVDTETSIVAPAPVEDAVTDRIALNWAIGKLAPQFRAAILLRGFHGLSYREIAELRNVPIDTAKSQISRGRRALLAFLQA
ncbi:RNA polymerase sigma factor [Dactylosporangium cerinum]|uniref:RNA polymerase sigma factor n=1 Tax=Dactylosporangium cerinum TaxID=1434730 RepID=A0ABV9WCN7_9ACTN